MAMNLLLIGGGGHCASVFDSALSMRIFDTIRIISKDLESDQMTNPALVIGTDNELGILRDVGYEYAFVAVGSIGDISTRVKLQGLLKRLNFSIPNIIDSSASMCKDANLGEGIYAGKNSVIGARSKIGNCAIINSAAVVEHDCTVADFVHIATAAVLCGNVGVGYGTHIGAGSTVKQGVRIGEGVMIGMGSVVLKDIDSHKTAYGNPCRVVL